MIFVIQLCEATFIVSLVLFTRFSPSRWFTELNWHIKAQIFNKIKLSVTANFRLIKFLWKVFFYLRISFVSVVLLSVHRRGSPNCVIGSLLNKYFGHIFKIIKFKIWKSTVAFKCSWKALEASTSFLNISTQSSYLLVIPLSNCKSCSLVEGIISWFSHLAFVFWRNHIRIVLDGDFTRQKSTRSLHLKLEWRVTQRRVRRGVQKCPAAQECVLRNRLNSREVLAKVSQQIL